MTEHSLAPIEPMYSEAHAAKKVGVKPRSLRTEREAGRIKFKRVAGKIMYRHSDLVQWQIEGETLCQDEARDLAWTLCANEAGPKQSTTSDGRKAAARASVAQAKRTSDALKSRSRVGSPSADTPPKAGGQVVPMK